MVKLSGFEFDFVVDCVEKIMRVEEAVGTNFIKVVKVVVSAIKLFVFKNWYYIGFDVWFVEVLSWVCLYLVREYFFVLYYRVSSRDRVWIRVWRGDRSN